MELEDLVLFLTEYLVPFMNGSRVEFPIGVADDASIDDWLDQRLLDRGIHLWEHIRSRLLVSLEIELGNEAQSGIAVVRLRPYCPLGASALVVEAIGHCHMRLHAIGFIEVQWSPFPPVFNAVRWPHGVRRAFARVGRRPAFFRPWEERHVGRQALGVVRGGRVHRRRGRRELALSGRRILALRQNIRRDDAGAARYLHELCQSPEPAPMVEVVPDRRRCVEEDGQPVGVAGEVAGERLDGGLEEGVRDPAPADALANNQPDVEIVGYRRGGDSNTEPAAARVRDGPSVVIHHRPVQHVDLTCDEDDPEEVTIDNLIDEGLVTSVPGNMQLDCLDLNPDDFE